MPRQRVEQAPASGTVSNLQCDGIATVFPLLGVTVIGPPLSVGSAQEQERNRSGECLRGDLNSGELASTDR
jgi:hypothetical protein